MTPWTVAHQALLSMGFCRQEYWVGCHFLLQGIFWTQGLNPRLLYWQADSLPLRHLGSILLWYYTQNLKSGSFLKVNQNVESEIILINWLYSVTLESTGLCTMFKEITSLISQ